MLRLAALATVATVADAGAACRCTDMSSSCWPSGTEWAKLNVSVHGRLLGGVAAESPVQACYSTDSGTSACANALENIAASEFWNQQYAGGFESTGMVNGFVSVASAYAVWASSAADVQAAVRFANQHHLRIAVKGSGHDYLGRNSAGTPGSLMISTYPMQGIHWAQNGKSFGSPTTWTVTVEAGVVWQTVYQDAQARGLYVPGGHCPSVGAVGGFSLGAGYGPYSKFYGTGADNMLEAVVVLASGEVVVANETSNADLFWAMRGGGGGTFGVAISITYMAHPFPDLGGTVSGDISCPSDVSFVDLMAIFLSFVPSILNPHWGNKASPNAVTRELNLDLQFLQMDERSVQKVWEPFVADVVQAGCTWKKPLAVTLMETVTIASGKKIINYYPYPGAKYPKTGNPEVDRHLVDGFLGQTNQWAFGAFQRYVPVADVQFAPYATAKKLVALSYHKTFYRVMNFAKSLGFGANAQNTSGNPAARLAAFAWMGNEHVANYFPKLPETAATLAKLVNLSGVKGYIEAGFCQQPWSNDCLSEASESLPSDAVEKCWADMHACFEHRFSLMDAYGAKVREAFPVSEGYGSYSNEGDYFEPLWQRAYWGSNYPALLRVKRQLDPAGLFVCRHCVGSEDYTEGGICRVETVAPEFTV